jgi:hypothetical protein
MAMFIDGPYNGRDLPFDPAQVRMIRLPPVEEYAHFEEERRTDPGATTRHDWPNLYRLDEAAVPPVFRFVQRR